MPERSLRRAVALTALLLAAVAPSTAHAEPLRRCDDFELETRCAAVTVPLDHAARVPGTLRLGVRRWRWAAPLRTPILVVGQPGWPATQDVASYAGTLDDFLQGQRRDLFVVDGRGADAVWNGCGAHAGDRAWTRCLQRVAGAPDAFGAEQVARDVERVHAALGLDRVILYAEGLAASGALRYAAAHHEHVERLVLDAPRAGLAADPFRLQSLARARRLLGDICRAGCPAGVGDPGAALGELARRLSAEPMDGILVDARGRARRRTLTAGALHRTLLDGDLAAEHLAGLPAALTAALRGDAAPALRAVQRASRRFGAPFATLGAACADTPWPWSPEAGLAQRLAQAGQQLAGPLARQVQPFAPATILAASTEARLCAAWPAFAPLAADRPAVPTLVLTGERDLHAAGAPQSASALPAAHLSVLAGRAGGAIDNGPYSCISHVLGRFLAARRPPARCDPRTTGSPEERAHARRGHAPAPPAALPPLSLSELPGFGRLPARDGRTLRAVVRTLRDVYEQRPFAGQEHAGHISRVVSGGLRGGRFTDTGRTLALHRFEYVPGVVLSGRLRLGFIGTLRITGPAASQGNVRIDGRGQVHGRLGVSRIRARLTFGREGLALARP